MAGDLLYCTSGGTLYRFIGDTSAIRDSFYAGFGNASDIAVVGQKVIVSRNTSATSIYIFDGFNPGFIDSYGFGTGNVRGCTSDGTNVIAVDATTGTIYGLVELTNVIDWSYASDGATSQGLTFDESNLITSTSNPLDKIWQHVLLTAAILQSFAAPAFVPTGLGFIKPNMWSTDLLTNLIYTHLNVSATISTSRAAPTTGSQGLSYLPDPYVTEIYII